jgi:hypothetical protein
VTQFDDVLVFYGAREAGFFRAGAREDEPVVVGVVEGIACDLLTL